MVCTGLFPLDRAEMEVKRCRVVGLLHRINATFLAQTEVILPW